MKKILVAIALFIPMSASFAAAPAWSSQFIPSSIYISGEANYHVRVSGIAAGICKGDFAYINLGDSGAKSYIAALMLAYANKKPISILYSGDATTTYCHIIEMASY